MADWTEQDVRQIREWNEKDHPRGQPNNAGQFVEKGVARNKTNLQKSLSREEYATLRAEVMRKQSQRGYSKKRDYAYTSDNFYVFDNDDVGKFNIKVILPVVGNEDTINMIWRWLDKDGETY